LEIVGWNMFYKVLRTGMELRPLLYVLKKFCGEADLSINTVFPGPSGLLLNRI
jgi:hypothetical protein